MWNHLLELEIVEKITLIIHETLCDNSIKIFPETRFLFISGIDSLKYIYILNKICNNYNIKVTSQMINIELSLCELSIIIHDNLKI